MVAVLVRKRVVVPSSGKKKKEEQIDRASAVLFIISLYRVVEVEEE